MTKFFAGMGVSSGIGIGKAFVIETYELIPSNAIIDEQQIENEIERFYKAIEKGKFQIKTIIDKQTDVDKIEIISAQIEILSDHSMIEKVEEIIKNQQKNMELAFYEVIEEFLEMFLQIEDEYLKARSLDIKDVYNRIMHIMKNKEQVDLSNIAPNTVIISKDLEASQLISMNTQNIEAIITEEGSATSHVSIIANNMNIPLIVGVKNIMSETSILKDYMVICEAENNFVCLTDNENEIQKYIDIKNDYYENLKKLDENKMLEAITSDGKKIRLCANISNEKEAEDAKNKNADGIGLFRTEFLYMENTHFPTEDEQINVYKKISDINCNKEVIIRTLDIGGDKQLEYYKFEHEENPFLGCRAIRLCFKLPNVFKTQLRAILRSNENGNIKIMLPMIISVDEFLKTKKIIEEIKEELKSEGEKINSKIQIGVMIETPASVIIAEELAKVSDFFSIGTNDLTQYILAVDRNNSSISNLYDTFNMAVLRCIKQVVDASHKYGKWTGVCGEFAGNAEATKILIGLGVDELSMSSNKISKIKDIILKSSYEQCILIAEKALGI